MYDIEIMPSLDRILTKLSKKDRKKVEIILKKISEISKNPHHYKNLRTPMEDFKRVHIDKSFVLIFTVDDNEKRITFVDFAHHDEIYTNKRLLKIMEKLQRE
jgi:YafQ family addiction module toxin component